MVFGCIGLWLFILRFFNVLETVLYVNSQHRARGERRNYQHMKWAILIWRAVRKLLFIAHWYTCLASSTLQIVAEEQWFSKCCWQALWFWLVLYGFQRKAGLYSHVRYICLPIILSIGLNAFSKFQASLTLRWEAKMLYFCEFCDNKWRSKG